jgi:L-alanine-DL-glutamate epimerase-like enolase superfamily enzyme
MEVRDGYIALPDMPGIGFEAQPALHKIMQDVADA